MILIVLAALCVASVPATRGRLSRLAEVRLRGLWLPIVALAAQTVITTLAPGGSAALHRTIHIGSYALLVAFVLLNRRLPGVPLVAAGMGLNGLAILANGGVMPAAASAERLAGLQLGAGFHNSQTLAHPALLWLGDIIPWPGPLPNVLSIGDVVVFAGLLVLLHRLSRRSAEPLSAAL